MTIFGNLVFTGLRVHVCNPLLNSRRWVKQDISNGLGLLVILLVILLESRRGFRFVPVEPGVDE